MRAALALLMLLCGCVRQPNPQVAPEPKLQGSADITLIAGMTAVQVFRVKDGDTTCYVAASIYTGSSAGAGIDCERTP